MGNLTEIDRLIEEGLTLYGRGDLDGALLSWEHVLTIDPENGQASSYVEYVRQNYELLNSEAGRIDERSSPFGIADEEPEYTIEILPGDFPVEPSPPPMYMDPLDQGWFMEDDDQPPQHPRTFSADMPEVTYELEADEPPAPVAPQPEAPPISFDDLTREYPGGPPAKRPEEPLPPFDLSPDPVTSEFRPDLTPGFGTPSDYQTPPGGFSQLTPGFEQVVTDIRQRDLGFVQPTAPASTPAPRERRPSQVPDGMKMTLRTPGDPLEADDVPPPASSEIELSYDDPPTQRRPASSLDLISSLPSPTPVPNLAVTSTRDLPAPTRTPGPQGGSPSTRDFPPQKTEKLPEGVRFILPDDADSRYTRDLPTSKIPSMARTPAPAADPDSARAMAGAPTRDLGLRPPGPQTPPKRELDLDLGPGGGSSPDDDAPTIFRKPRSGDGTNSDVILPFDPIDARSAQILDDIDVGAPAQEPKEDRTRRRITKLFEHAIKWSHESELDRAVTAIDLALSEDPTSALAQKLIHRNRDTMMTVFQAFLGDLQRQPTLARPLHELASAPISPRAAFLLSRVDGQLSLDEILDVSGMPRLEAYRYLCQLFLRGILR